MHKNSDNRDFVKNAGLISDKSFIQSKTFLYLPMVLSYPYTAEHYSKHNKKQQKMKNYLAIVWANRVFPLPVEPNIMMLDFSSLQKVWIIIKQNNKIVSITC